MKLQQLKYLKAIREHNLNISSAAGHLFTSQPGISKQIGLLEAELGVKIFARKGRNIQKITPVGMKIFAEVEKMLLLEEKIKTIAKENTTPNSNPINIYTTHTIARYLMPNAILKLKRKYPDVEIHLYPSVEPDDAMKKGNYDLSIVAQEISHDHELLVIPAYLWTLSLILPKSHPLADGRTISLADLANYPLLSYEQGATGRLSQDVEFAKAGLTPDYFMMVMDANVIKKYVELDFGIGIISTLAANDIDNDKMCSISLSHLFKPSAAWLCFNKNIYLQSYMFEFIENFAPQLTKETMENIIYCKHPDQLSAIYNELQLPVY